MSFRLCLIYFFVALVTAGYITLCFVLISPVQNLPDYADDYEYPLDIIEVPSNASEVASYLEDAGAGPVLWAGNVTVPLSRVDRVDWVNLSSLALRLDADDLRLTPYAGQLLSVFTSETGTGEYLFVSAESGEAAEILDDSAFSYVVHRQEGLPAWSGFALWLLTLIVFLIAAGNRGWTLVTAIVLLPVYALNSALVLSLLTIVFIALREVAVALVTGFRNFLNEQQEPDIDVKSEDSLEQVQAFPGKLSRLPQFLFTRIRSDAPFRMMWVSLISLLLVGFAFVPAFAVSALIIPSLICFFIVVLAVMYRHSLFTASQEHLLFVARSITPSWDKPAKKERVALVSIISLLMVLPLVFQVNSAQFPAEFIRAVPMYSDDVAVEEFSDDYQLERLLTEVTAELERRIQGGNRLSASEPSPGALHPAVMLLSDAAYQAAYPYLAVTSDGLAGRYEDGNVYLTRYQRGEAGLESFDELVFSLDRSWIQAQVETAPPFSMLRLYSHRDRWYDVRPETGSLVIPRLWNIVPEVLLLIVLSLPWLGRWQFAPLQWILSRFKSGRSKN